MWVQQTLRVREAELAVHPYLLQGPVPHRAQLARGVDLLVEAIVADHRILVYRRRTQHVAIFVDLG